MTIKHWHILSIVVEDGKRANGLPDCDVSEFPITGFIVALNLLTLIISYGILSL
jgi:hypothetical protein